MKVSAPWYMPILLLVMALSSASCMNDGPDFRKIEFPDMSGKVVSLQDFKGKVVLLNFWATWCAPCIEEMPSMQRLKDKLAGEDFEIVAINMSNTPQDIQNFFAKSDVEYQFPILLDTEGSSFTTLNIRGLPASYILNKEGEMVQEIMGGREWDDAENLEMIKELLH